MVEIKNCLDIILLGDYNFSVFGAGTLIFFIRERTDGFISLVSEQLNSFIKTNFKSDVDVEFKINIMPGLKKGEAELLKKTAD
jgi:hypothetical protein